MPKFLIAARAEIVCQVIADDPEEARERAGAKLFEGEIEGWDLTPDYQVTEWTCGEGEGKF